MGVLSCDGMGVWERCKASKGREIRKERNKGGEEGKGCEGWMARFLDETMERWMDGLITWDRANRGQPVCTEYKCRVGRVSGKDGKGGWRSTCPFFSSLLFFFSPFAFFFPIFSYALTNIPRQFLIDIACARSGRSLELDWNWPGWAQCWLVLSTEQRGVVGWVGTENASVLMLWDERVRRRERTGSGSERGDGWRAI